MKTSPLRASMPRSVVGILFLALGLFLCSGLPAHAHVADDTTARLFHDLVGEQWFAPLERETAPQPVEAGPQADCFDAVDETHLDTRVDTLHDWRRPDAALARPETTSAPGLSETLTDRGRPSLRPSRGLGPQLSHTGSHGALVSSPPVPPLRATHPVAVPLGTPRCFLPAARGLVSFPLPPPHC